MLFQGPNRHPPCFDPTYIHADYLDYRRGWIVGVSGQDPGSLKPLYPDEFKRGFKDGYAAFVTAMRAHPRCPQENQFGYPT